MWQLGIAHFDFVILFTLHKTIFENSSRKMLICNILLCGKGNNFDRKSIIMLASFQNSKYENTIVTWSTAMSHMSGILILSNRLENSYVSYVDEYYLMFYIVLNFNLAWTSDLYWKIKIECYQDVTHSPWLCHNYDSLVHLLYNTINFVLNRC